jgi:archaellin
MKNENIYIINSFYDYFINLTESKKGIDKEKLVNRFIDSAKKYAEKTSTKTFCQVTNYLSKDYKDEIKIHTLLFVNKLLSFIKKEKQIEILLLFVEENIFDLLLLIKLNDNEEFVNQINIFGSLIEKILENSNKEKEIYKTIKTKYDYYYEAKTYNDIKGLTLKIHNSVGKEQINYIDELVKLVNKKKAYEILYKTFMDNNNNNIAFSYFDIFVRIFGTDQKGIMLLIDIAKKYSEKNNCKMFNKFIEYTSDKNTNDFVKGQSMQILNMIINFSESNKQYELLVLYEEMGFFENLHYLINNKDLRLQGQMKLFLSFVKELLNQCKIKDEKYNAINEKYKKVLEDKKIYDKIVDEFVVVDDFEK